MKEQLIAILETFGFPVYLQGSLASTGDYPESFFTFWCSQRRRRHSTTTSRTAVYGGFGCIFTAQTP